MNAKEIIDSLKKFDELNWKLQLEYEEGEGEITESTEAKEEQIAIIRELLTSPEAIDELGRWLAAKQQKEDALKDEAAKIARLRKENDETMEFIKQTIRRCIDTDGSKPEARGLLYSFTNNDKNEIICDKEAFKAFCAPLVKDAMIKADLPSWITASVDFSKTELRSINPESWPAFFSEKTINTVKFNKPRKSSK